MAVLRPWFASIRQHRRRSETHGSARPPSSSPAAGLVAGLQVRDGETKRRWGACAREVEAYPRGGFKRPPSIDFIAADNGRRNQTAFVAVMSRALSRTRRSRQSLKEIIYSVAFFFFQRQLYICKSRISKMNYFRAINN